jgi:hypothetical protein
MTIALRKAFVATGVNPEHHPKPGTSRISKTNTGSTNASHLHAVAVCELREGRPLT